MIIKLELKGRLVLFADDMSYMMSARNYEQLNQDIKHNMNEISKWLKVNRLVLNYNKTKYMIMSSPREDSLEHIKSTINNKIIPSV